MNAQNTYLNTLWTAGHSFLPNPSITRHFQTLLQTHPTPETTEDPTFTKALQAGLSLQDPNTLCAFAFALGRCADIHTIPRLQTAFQNTQDPGAKRMLLDAIFCLAQQHPNLLQELQQHTLQQLPDRLRETALLDDPQPFQDSLQTHLSSPHLPHNPNLLYSLYLLHNTPHVRTTLLNTLRTIPFHTGHFASIRAILKSSLYRLDAETIAVLAFRLDTTRASGNPDAALPALRAYSIGTRTALRNHLWRALQDLVQHNHTHAYTHIASAILCAFDQPSLDAHPHNPNHHNPPRFSHTTAVEAFAFNHILFNPTPARPGTRAWARNTQERHQLSTPPFQRAFTPHAWHAHPNTLLQLLLTSPNTPTTHFAFDALLHSPSFTPSKHNALSLLHTLPTHDQPHTPALAYALQHLAKHPLDDLEKEDWNAILNTLSNPSVSSEDPNLLLTWLHTYPDELLRDKNLVVSLLTHTDETLRNTICDILASSPLTASKQRAAVRAAIKDLSKHTTLLLETHRETLQAILFSLRTFLPEGVQALPSKTLLKLLQHDSQDLHLFALSTLYTLSDDDLLEHLDTLLDLLKSDQNHLKNAVIPIFARLSVGPHSETLIPTLHTLLETFTDSSTGGGPYNIHFTPNDDAFSSSSLNSYALARVRQGAPHHDGALLTGDSWETLIGPRVDDSTSPYTPIGFDFPLANATHEHFCVDSNGWLAFEGYWNGSYSNYNGFGRNSAVGIFPWWADLHTGHDGYVRTTILGTAPARVRVIEWRVYAYQGHSQSANITLTFQCCLHETSGNIVLRFGPSETTGYVSYTPTMACGIALNTQSGTRNKIRDFFGTNGTPPGSKGPFRTDLTTQGDNPHYPGVPNCGLSDGNTTPLDDLKRTANTITESFAPLLRTLDLGLVHALLAHPLEPAQDLAAFTLKHHTTPFSQYSPDLVRSILLSNTPSIQETGASLLRNATPSLLLPHTNALCEFVTKTNPQQLQPLTPLLNATAELSPPFALQLAQSIIQTHDEPHETLTQLVQTILNLPSSHTEILLPENAPQLLALATHPSETIALLPSEILLKNRPWNDLPADLLHALCTHRRGKVRSSARKLIRRLPDDTLINTHRGLLFTHGLSHNDFKKILLNLAAKHPETFASPWLSHILSHASDKELSAIPEVLDTIPTPTLNQQHSTLSLGSTHHHQPTREHFQNYTLSLCESSPGDALSIGLYVLKAIPQSFSPPPLNLDTFFIQLLTSTHNPALLHAPSLLARANAHKLPSIHTPAHAHTELLFSSHPDDSSLPLLRALLNTLTRNEPWEGSHTQLVQLLTERLDSQLDRTQPLSVWRLIHASNPHAQSFGALLLKRTIPSHSISIRQLAKLACHDLQEIRTLAQTMYTENIPRLRENISESLRILDSPWDDSRSFAFDFFRDNFGPDILTAPVLISICDSVRDDVQRFARELITRYFGDEDGTEYLLKLSQHPDPNVELFVTNYLERFAANSPNHIQELQPYFLRVLCRVNQGRIAKTRVFDFLQREGLRNPDSAAIILPILHFVCASNSTQDRATSLLTMATIQSSHPHLPSPLTIHTPPTR